MGKIKREQSLKYSDYHWIDAHCHLCSPPLSENWLSETEKAERYNISLFISTALNRKEIDWHLHNYNSNVKFVAGLHPYYDKSNITDIKYIEELAEKGLLWGIGEIGFDKRKNNHNFQYDILCRQLEIATKYNLPVVFHIVGRYNELYQVLNYEYPDIKGYIHGFSGSEQLVQMLGRLNIAFSLGQKILLQKNSSETIKSIIENGSLLFETDAPFQTMNKQTTDHLSSLKYIIEKVSELASVPENELLELQWTTYQILTQT